MPPRLNRSRSSASRRSTMPTSGSPSRNSSRARHHDFAHRRTEAGREPPRDRVVHRTSRGARSRCRAECRRGPSQVHRDVLPEIGELQRRAGGVGEPLPLGVAVAAQVQHQPADGVRRIAAVVEQLVPVSVARDGLVLHERANQIGERLGGKLVLRGPSAAARRRPDALASPAYSASSSPRHQASRRRLSARVADLVAEVVRPAAERIDVVEILVQMLGQQKADDVEIFVMMSGEPAGVGERLRQAPGAASAASGERTKFAGRRTWHASLRNDRRLHVAVVAHQVAHHFEQIGQRLFAIDEDRAP